MTYTKGNWEAVEQGKELQSESGEHEVVTTIDGNLINICQTFSGQFETDDLPEYVLTSDEALANARLIAAAPDLLEALESLLAIHVLPFYNDNWTAKKLNDTLVVCQKAISKAKGESK